VNGAAAVVDGVAYVMASNGLDLATRTVVWERTDLGGTSTVTWDAGTLFARAEGAIEEHRDLGRHPGLVGSPRVVAHPGLPRIRTCVTDASGSSDQGFAA
jgi:hypothetical protein